MRAKSNRVREGNGGRFEGKTKRLKKRKEKKSFCFVVVNFELIFGRLCFYVASVCMEFFLQNCTVI